MIDFKEYIDELLIEADVPEDFNRLDLIQFLQDNNWFDFKPDFSNGKVELHESQIDEFSVPILKFLKEKNRNSESLMKMFKEKRPRTAAALEKYFKEESEWIDEDTKFYVTDFLLYRLNKELVSCNNDDIKTICTLAINDLTKNHGQFLTDFISWYRTETKTKYNVENFMGKRYQMTDQNKAYNIKTYLKLMYLLLNEDYINENDMYYQAANSKNYTDAWLYLSLHFVCSLRGTDLERLPHPTLADDPQTVLDKIASDSFTDTEAMRVLTSFTNYLDFFRLTPNKTSGTQGVNELKIEISTSCEVHFGKMFALAEAHWQLAGKDTPLVKIIKSYDQISRYLGNEIGDLFLERDFGSRSANKSYLQSILTFGDKEDPENGLNVKGYILASYARSHKGSYHAFAETTLVYLQDCTMAGITPEMAAFELLNRGVLSRVLSMLLEMMLGKETYKALPVSKQTELIRELNLNTYEAETIVASVSNARERAALIAHETSTSMSQEAILEVMHRIGNGLAPAKTDTEECLIHALGKNCPYKQRKSCIGCEFEIVTRSTFLFYIDEYNRMLRLYKNATAEHEQYKYKYTIQKEIQPALIEMLNMLKENYGEDVYETYKTLLKEKLND